MPSQAVHAAVLARLEAGWTTTPVFAPSTSAKTPTNGSPFLTVQFPIADQAQVTVGSPGANIFRESGAIRLILSVPRGGGLDPYLGWADQLRSLFRARQFAGVSTFAPSPVTIDDRSEDGLYVLLSFAVPYTADLLG